MNVSHTCIHAHSALPISIFLLAKSCQLHHAETELSVSLVLGGTHGGGDQKKEGGNMGLSNPGNKHMAPKQPK